MQPQAMGLGDFADRAQRVKGGGGRGASCGHNRARLVAGSQVLLDRRPQGLWTQRVLFVCGDEADIIAAKTRQQRGLVYRAVGMSTDIHDQRPGFGLQAAAYQGVVGGAFTGADQRHQGAGRRGVLDHSAPLARQAQQLTQPVEGGFFQARSVPGWIAKTGPTRPGRC